MRTNELIPIEDETRSISELLRVSGYGHEGPGIEHRVFRLADNETVGFMTANKAVVWMQDQGFLAPAIAQAEV